MALTTFILCSAIQAERQSINKENHMEEMNRFIEVVVG